MDATTTKTMKAKPAGNEELLLERSQLGAQFPGPYKFKIKKGDQTVSFTNHPTLASLEIEVDVAKNMIASGNADDYEVEGFPKDKLHGRLELPR